MAQHENPSLEKEVIHSHMISKYTTLYNANKLHATALLPIYNRRRRKKEKIGLYIFFNPVISE